MSKHQILAACLAGAFLLSPQFGSIAMAEGIQGEEHCVVNVATWDRLNMRSDPYSSADIVAKHRYGDCGIVVIGECEDGWCPVEDGHYDGWINEKYISMVSPALYCVTDVDDDDVLNLRAYPSTVSKIIAELDPHQCDIAFLPYAVGSWQKVRADGDEGWVNRKYVSGE